VHQLLTNNVLGWISVILVLSGVVPYYYSIFRGNVKPHVFSWLIWTIVSGISFAAEISDHAGPGAWSTGIASFNCFLITVISIFKGEKDFSSGDIAALLCALLSLPIWQLTHSPLASVIIVTFIDVIGFYPTIRKSYSKPFEEDVFMYFATALNYIIALLAIQHWTIVTWLYPACTAMTCGLMVALLITRRRCVSKNLDPLRCE